MGTGARSIMQSFLPFSAQDGKRAFSPLSAKDGKRTFSLFPHRTEKGHIYGFSVPYVPGGGRAQEPALSAHRNVDPARTVP